MNLRNITIKGKSVYTNRKKFHKFAKSHFTSLRSKLVNGLNEKLFLLTNNEKCIIETKHPKDNRIKVYKVDSSIIKRKISFLTFLFKT